MKVVILAGGMGTRLAEETTIRPKPLVEIGDKPILWHLMSIYSAFGFQEFILALGHKSEVIKQYFLNLYALNGDMTIDLADRKQTVHNSELPNWRIHLIDTGRNTQTGGRIKRLRPMIGDETFMATYADGLAKIDLNALLAFHRSHGKLATVTVVHPPSRFGKLVIEGDLVRNFMEKPPESEGWINGGFFVFEPEMLEYIDGDEISLEREPMERLAKDGQLVAYRHSDFWQMMDTLQEKRLLEELWSSAAAPWKVWK